jgi:hypothetical protein
MVFVMSVCEAGVYFQLGSFQLARDFQSAMSILLSGYPKAERNHTDEHQEKLHNLGDV